MLFELVFRLCVAFQHLVGFEDAQFAGLRDVETALAGVLHEYLDDTAVVVRLGECGVQLDGFRIVLVSLRQTARKGQQVGAVVVGVGEIGEELDGLVQVGYGLVVAVRAFRIVVQSIVIRWYELSIDEMKSIISARVVERFR